jgi:hypothetical protein
MTHFAFEQRRVPWIPQAQPHGAPQEAQSRDDEWSCSGLQSQPVAADCVVIS